MQGGTRRVVLFGLALGLALCVLFPDCAALPATGGSTPSASEELTHRDRREEHVPTRRELQNTAVIGGGAPVEGVRVKSLEVNETNISDGEVPETYSIHAIDTPLKHSPGQPLRENTGIFLTALGEPKSGTTWIARVIVELCVQLCGNPENTWCKMGGLKITNSNPAPRYIFEMLHADTDQLFLYFEGKWKHLIPGLGDKGCAGNMTAHHNGFGDEYPCPGGGILSRGALAACLPDITPECASRLSPLDPARRRIAVIFRDARNLIVSEHRMRREVYHQDIAELEPFILARFQTVVAWIHQRYSWHTTALEEITHIMFYEDLQTNPRHLVDLAAFLGLDCTPEEAQDVFQRHAYAEPPGDYTTYGLSTQTLEWMNATMSTTLPEVMLARYGLTPIWE